MVFQVQPDMRIKKCSCFAFSEPLLSSSMPSHDMLGDDNIPDLYTQTQGSFWGWGLCSHSVPRLLGHTLWLLDVKFPKQFSLAQAQV